MAYTKTELLALGIKDLSEARGKIVNISLFDHVDDIFLCDKNKNIFEYTLELYREYLAMLNEFSKTNLEQILKSLRNIEVIDNHSLERENYDLLKSYSENHHSTAISYLNKKLMKEGNELTSPILKKTYEILMRGTSSESESSIRYRTDNNHYVGYVENNKPFIEFFPISYDEIDQAMSLLFEFYNSGYNLEEELFTKPFIVHGLLAALQAFPDGNTRLSRTIQHINLFDSTLKILNINLDYPAIYFSKTYIPYRKQYRELIAKIALMPNNETWNEWIKFNLLRLQDQIFMNENQLKRTRRI